jgi:putative ABC transport system permease protein
VELFAQARVSVRTLLRNRIFSAVAIVTLALGLGAVSLVFTVTVGLLTARIPYQQPDATLLVQPSLSDWRVFGLLRDNRGPFEAVAAYNEKAANLADDRGSDRILVGRITDDFLSLATPRVVIGRGFLPDDFAARIPTVVLLTDAFWRHRFAASPSVVGQGLALDDRVYTIVGILAPGFRAPQDLPAGRNLTARIGAEVLVPLTGDPRVPDPLSTDRMWRGVNVLVRLRPGSQVEQGRLHVQALARSLTGSPRQIVNYRLTRLTDYVAGDLPQQATILGAAVLLLLLVASANVMQLFLARGLARQKEMALRSALGASRRHLIHSSVSESMVLSVCGGALGIAIAWAGKGVLVRLAADWLSRVDEVRLDWRVLAFSALLAVVTGLAVGLVPGVHACLVDPLRALRGQVDARGHRRHGRLRTALVTAQVALSVTLLIVGGLLARDLMQLARIDQGFDPTGVLLGEVSLSRVQYARPEESDRVFHRLLVHGTAIHGVESVALTNSAPGGVSRAAANVSVGRSRRVGADTADETEACEVVQGRYFETLRIGIEAGRPLGEGDGRTAEPVVVVNEAFARKYWGAARSAIDQQVAFGGRGYRVVGVAANVRDSMTVAAPRLYFPYEQFAGWPPQMTLLVRERTTSGAPVAAAAALIAELNRIQPMYDVRPLSALVSGQLARRALVAMLVALFAVVTIIVSSVGVYGAAAYAASERAQEVAIRLAVGGSVRQVVGHVARRGAVPVLAGIALGVALAFSLAALIRSQLVGVTSTDGVTYVSAALLVAILGLAGTIGPVVRVVLKQPLEALRQI